MKFVVTKDGGQKFLSAMPSTFTEAQSVEEIVSKGVQGSKPAILCVEPEIVREVRINLKTGDVVK